jgi:hypothetical protein
MSNPNPRRVLSADGLMKTLRFRFEHIPDARRQSSVVHRLPDLLMAAFAIFSLKDPSLLAFKTESMMEPSNRCIALTPCQAIHKCVRFWTPSNLNC